MKTFEEVWRPVYRYNVQGAYDEAPGDVIFFKDGVESKLPVAPGDIPE